MKRFYRLLAALAAAGLALSGCMAAESAATPDSGQPQNEKLQVVTTIFPPYDFVRQIGGDRVELTMLLSPGAESHSYDPTPQDIITIQNSDLFLYVGGEGDQWVHRILESMDTQGMTILPLIGLVDVVEEEIVEGMEHGHDDEEQEEHDDDDEDHEHSVDEHVWTSPQNAAVIVEKISAALCELDKDNAGDYQQNTEAYLKDLAELDRSYRDVADRAARRTLVFGDRFPFRYLADAYGLQYFAAFPGCSTETEASAATVAFLIDQVRDEEIPVVFHIELSNEKMADTISEATGANKLLLHSCHNVSRDDFAAGATYLSLMERNLEHLKEALL